MLNVFQELLKDAERLDQDPEIVARGQDQGTVIVDPGGFFLDTCINNYE